MVIWLEWLEVLTPIIEEEHDQQFPLFLNVVLCISPYKVFCLMICGCVLRLN